MTDKLTEAEEMYLQMRTQRDEYMERLMNVVREVRDIQCQAAVNGISMFRYELEEIIRVAEGHPT